MVVLHSRAADIWRQQIKILDVIKDHHRAMLSLRKDGNKCMKVLIGNYIKLRSKLKFHSLSLSKRDVLLRRPGLFQLDHILDKDNFHFGDNWASYGKYIAKEE